MDTSVGHRQEHIKKTEKTNQINKSLSGVTKKVLCITLTPPLNSPMIFTKPIAPSVFVFHHFLMCFLFLFSWGITRAVVHCTVEQSWMKGEVEKQENRIL